MENRAVMIFRDGPLMGESRDVREFPERWAVSTTEAVSGLPGGDQVYVADGPQVEVHGWAVRQYSVTGGRS